MVKREAPLTDKELAVIQAIANVAPLTGVGFVLWEAADELNIPLKRLEAYLNSVEKKLGIRNALGVVVHAFRMGWIK